ncbi:MAG: hypothetical protein ACE5JI_22100 [Acidobacteriota bacterium]
MKKISVVLIGLVFVSICHCAFGQEPRKIEFWMMPGKSATYDIRAETTTEYVSYRSAGTEKRTIGFKSDMRIVLRSVKATSDGVIHLEITYPDFFIETAVTEGGSTSKIVTDSNGARSYVDGKLQEQTTWEEQEKQGRPNLKKLFSSVIEFALHSTGKVLDVTTPAELATRFTWVDIKNFFQNQVIFPEVAIAPGAEWNQTSDREVPQGPGPLGGSIMLDETAYKYQGNEMAMGRECARISVVVASRLKEEIQNLNEFKQTNKGWSLIALENGQTVISEMNLFQEMKGTPRGVRTEVKTTGTVTTRLVQSPTPAAAPSEKKPPVEAR